MHVWSEDTTSIGTKRGWQPVTGIYDSSSNAWSVPVTIVGADTVTLSFTPSGEVLGTSSVDITSGIAPASTATSSTLSGISFAKLVMTVRYNQDVVIEIQQSQDSFSNIDASSLWTVSSGSNTGIVEEVVAPTVRFIISNSGGSTASGRSVLRGRTV